MQQSSPNPNIYEIKPEGWGDEEKAIWLAEQKIKRSYKDEVVSLINTIGAELETHFSVKEYGALSYDTDKYPLYLFKSKNWDPKKPSVLITGGVHGYETSGVHGALAFVRNHAVNYLAKFNLVIAPCISPWGYETINRWNPKAVDPNRSFIENGPSEEANQIIQAVADISDDFLAHVDLHETTDTDNTVFRPALAARDGIVQKTWNIPDGFYLVDDSENPNDDFQKAIIKSVEKVTHIALPDENNELIGEPMVSHGVIRYPLKKLSLCTSFTNSQYTTTTEVYPDSPKVTNDNCNDAQVAACVGALDYLLSLNKQN